VIVYVFGNGSYGRTVGRPRSADSSTKGSRRWSGSALERVARSSQRHSLGVTNWCAVARSARSISSIPNVPSTISAMGPSRRIETNPRKPCTRPARARRPRPSGMLRRRHFCPGEKRGACVGKTKRGKGTKVMAVADRAGLPIALCIESASPHEVTLVDALLKARFVRKLPQRLIGDMAYDSDALDRRLAHRRIEMISPHRSNRRRQATQDGRSLRRYKRRWKVERLFAWLQNFRRLVVRYEYHSENYLAFLSLGCILILLRNLL
jgi:transposase